MLADAAGLIYGTITVAALLAAESARQETYGETVGAVAIALVLYWVAHSYAEFTGERVGASEPFTYQGLVRTATEKLAVLLGAALPLAAILICWAIGAALSTAVSAGIWTSVTIVIGTEVAIGVRAELTGRELIRQTAVGVVLGLLVLALRVLLH
jgi:hypothetical protein